MIGIYKITSPSKKVYIGQSTDFDDRFRRYRLSHCKEQPKLYNSLKKYGFKNHKFEILIECDVSELNDKERYFQDLYSSAGPKGLNCVLTKSSDRSGKHSEDSIEKMRIARSKRSKESIDKYIKTRTGCKVSEETKLKISNSLKGKKLSEETKCKMSIARIGSKNHKSKKVICSVTKTIYDSVAICERENNLPFNSLCNKLNGNRTNNTNFIYL